MDLNSRVLFNHDRNDRITTVNESPYEPAPRIYLGSTRAGNIARYRSDLDGDLKTELHAVISENPGEHIADMARILGKRQEITKIWIGPAFVFPELKTANTAAVQITQDNRGLFRNSFPT